jgi:hypothetical protein
MQEKIKLYAIPGSHPVMAARLMLELKGRIATVGAR